MSTKKVRDRTEMDFAEVAQQLTAGTMGGIACTVVGYPLDTLKTRLQMGAQFSELVKTLSVRNLFSGIAAPIYGAMPCWAAGYFGYSFGKHLAWSWYPENKNDSPSSRISASELILGGITSGILASFVRCPADVVKVKCQVEVAHIVAQPPLHMCTVVQFLGRKTATVLRELLSSSRGAYSLVRGLMPTLVHTIPASTIFFGSYDIFHNEIFKNYEGNLRPLLSGALAGIAEWGCFFPFDTFKTRVQASSGASLVEVWQQLYNEAGRKWLPTIAKLYRGVVPMLIRAAPANGVALTTVEFCRRHMKEVFE